MSPKDKWGDEYDSSDEGPEAKMHREQQWMEASVEKFIDALTSGDSQIELFSFWDIVLFNLHRRRLKRRG